MIRNFGNIGSNFINMITTPQYFIPYVIAILLALMLHEMGHALAAYHNGDTTAKDMGRLSFNPLKHLDPVGTILILVFGFGWAKPVMINENNFKNPRKGVIEVSLAGVAMNFLLAFVSVGLGMLLNKFGAFNHAIETNFGFSLSTMLFYLFAILPSLNVSLMIFNLLPIPPLDGYNFFKELTIRVIPMNFFYQYERIGRYIIWLIFIIGAGAIVSVPSAAVLNGINWFWGLIIR